MLGWIVVIGIAAGIWMWFNRHNPKVKRYFPGRLYKAPAPAPGTPPKKVNLGPIEWIWAKRTGGTIAWLMLVGLLGWLVIYAMTGGSSDPMRKAWWSENFSKHPEYFVALVLSVAVLAILGARGGTQKMEIGHILTFVFFTILAGAAVHYGSKQYFGMSFGDLIDSAFADDPSNKPPAVRASIRVIPHGEVGDPKWVFAPASGTSPRYDPKGLCFKLGWVGERDEVKVYYDGKLYTGTLAKDGDRTKIAYWQVESSTGEIKSVRATYYRCS